jgi:hypothetical protein
MKDALLRQPKAEDSTLLGATRCTRGAPLLLKQHFHVGGVMGGKTFAGSTFNGHLSEHIHQILLNAVVVSERALVRALGEPIPGYKD